MTRFDSEANSYEASVDGSISFSGSNASDFARRKARQLLDVCNRQCGDPSELSVLDAGCGVGLTDEYLVDHVRELHGVDISARAVEYAARRNPGARYQLSDSGPFPFDDGTFDAAFAACVFHHIPPVERRSFAMELRRVVRPHGMVMVFEHNPFNPLTRLAVARCEFDDDAILLRRRALRDLLASAGLRPRESRYVVFFPRGGTRVETAERWLGRVPLGAQYYVAAANAWRDQPVSGSAHGSPSSA